MRFPALSDQQLAVVVRSESVHAWMTRVSDHRGAERVSVTRKVESSGKESVKVPEVLSVLQVAESGIRMESRVQRPVTMLDASEEEVVSQERRTSPSRPKAMAAAGNGLDKRKGKAHLVVVAVAAWNWSTDRR